MKGSKYSENDRLKVRHLYAKGMTTSQISKKTGIPYSTLVDWKRECEVDETFVELREDYKKRFEDTITDCIDKGTRLIQKAFGRALDEGEVLDRLLKDYKKACEEDGEEPSKEEIKALAKKISALKCEDTAKIATTVGTLYDKRALSQGKETQIVGVSFEDMPE